MEKLERKKMEAMASGSRQSPEVAAIEDEISNLKETVRLWREGAQRLEWKANLAARQEKIQGYEESARGATDFEDVSGTVIGSENVILVMFL